MSRITDKILRILHECHPNKDDFVTETRDSSDSKESRGKLEEMKSRAERIFTVTQCNYIASVEYASLNKLLALCNLETGNESTAIHHLVEAHAVILRQHILHRYRKTQLYESMWNQSQLYGLKPSHVKFETTFTDNSESLKRKLLNLPKEWYMIQVTAQYESPTILRYKKLTSNVMHAVHITVLPTGVSDVEPLCITVPRPATQVSYDICKEIRTLLDGHPSMLKTTYTNHEQYWMMRANYNNRMKIAINGLENLWLREWRVLFMADSIENLEIVDEIHQMVDKLILDCKSPDEISNRCRWLLRKVSTGACFLTREEIARAIKFLLPEHEKLANNIILSIYGKLPYIRKLEHTKRKTLVLIIDEHMDYIAFEAMEIIKNHPVTRFPSLHVAYALFKEHQDTIVDGCKIIKVRDNMGTCIVNPSGDLDKMEKRIKLFMDFWLSQWKSCYNAEPSAELFEDALINRDILMYAGHGNGIEYLSGEDIEKMRVKSTVLLFGCNSVKLLVIGGRFPPYGVSNQYLIACSPCLLGMLWEVTDVDIDKMTTNFLSNWIPSFSEKSWAEIDMDSWCHGVLKFTKTGAKDKTNMEPEMLRAVAKSKSSCSQYMTAAAIVVRGLPIKIL
ncbi:PREDICTED: separin [Vollenhovia emeryi]|uniref:separin n=1 Tax=Vollenhovia emeryi TaxID=411798 RepID=UPI0005F3E738|nr:PREDICTED: separin [Vollenhovia emeryi]